MKTYVGSCHWGAVRYEADVDLSAGTSKCNCSFCTKIRWWMVPVKPDAFRQLGGEDELAEYQFGSRSVHHLFCRNCGIHPFACGHLEVLSGDFYSINLACLDNVVSSELAEAPVTYFDGRNNNWQAPPTETRHL